MPVLEEAEHQAAWVAILQMVVEHQAVLEVMPVLEEAEHQAAWVVILQQVVGHQAVLVVIHPGEAEHQAVGGDPPGEAETRRFWRIHPAEAEHQAVLEVIPLEEAEHQVA